MSPHRNNRPDAISRRQMLRLGGFSGMGLTLPWFLRGKAAQAAGKPDGAAASRINACIVIFYYGGPSHLDMWDMKPHAPVEIRGEFKSIATSATGVRLCEHMPHMAQQMHRVALVRSMHHTNRLHDSAGIETLTGRQAAQGDREEFAPIPQFYPCWGATCSYFWRGRRLDVPHAALPHVFHNVVDVPCQGGGFLGAAYDPLRISVDVETRAYRAGDLDAPAEGPGLLPRRRALLESLDAFSASGAAASVGDMRRSYDDAFRLLASQKVRQALDLSKEPQSVRDRYGYGPPPATRGEGGGGGNGAELAVSRQMRGQNLLLARRLVEAGVPFVNVYDFRQQGQNWDAHFKCFNQHRAHLLPLADQSLSALIEDLAARGLLETTLVVALGEFGRTPQINKEGGRDHWPDCYTVLLAGGGVKGGFVYGASDKHGAYPAADGVTPADLAATVFWRLGIDPATHIRDHLGRPHKVAEGSPITALFS